MFLGDCGLVQFWWRRRGIISGAAGFLRGGSRSRATALVSPYQGLFWAFSVEIPLKIGANFWLRMKGCAGTLYEILAVEQLPSFEGARASGKRWPVSLQE